MFGGLNKQIAIHINFGNPLEINLIIIKIE